MFRLYVLRSIFLRKFYGYIKIQKYLIKTIEIPEFILGNCLWHFNLHFRLQFKNCNCIWAYFELGEPCDEPIEGLKLSENLKKKKMRKIKDCCCVCFCSALLAHQPYKETSSKTRRESIWRSLNNSYLPQPTLAYPVASGRETEV